MLNEESGRGRFCLIHLSTRVFQRGVCNALDASISVDRRFIIHLLSSSHHFCGNDCISEFGLPPVTRVSYYHSLLTLQITLHRILSPSKFNSRLSKSHSIPLLFFQPPPSFTPLFFFFGIRSLLSLTQTHTLINTNQKQKNMGTAYTQNYSNVAPPKMNQNMNGTCIPRGMGIR